MKEAATSISNLGELDGPAAPARRLPLDISERKVLLNLMDLAAVNGALAIVARWAGTPVRQPLFFVGLSALWLLFAWSLDAYDLCPAGQWPASVRRVSAAALLTYGVGLPLLYLASVGLRPWLSLGLLLGLSELCLALERGLYVLALRQPAFRRRTLVIGAGDSGHLLTEALAESRDPCYEILGFVDDNPDKMGGGAEGLLRAPPLSLSPPLPCSSAPLLVLGDRHALPRLITEQRVSTLVLAIRKEVNGELLQVLMDCLELGVEILPMPVLYEQLTGRVPVEHMGGAWKVSMPIHHPGTSMLWPMTKRLMDVVLSALGLCCLGLALPWIAAAIYLDSPGPIFYSQERVGQGGRHFRVYKFRSMVPDAENGQALWADRNDARVTRVGRLLRKTHVDEFPQFLNILKGEMSAVGPRPERPEFVEELAREIPFFRVRHAVKPGMAGWGLVKQGYGASKEDALLKLQYDLYYIKHQSLWLDLVILTKTVAGMLSFRGRA